MKKTKEKTMVVILAIGFTALCGCSNTHKTVATEELQCITTESVTETSITSEYTDEEMEQMKSDVTQAFWNLQNEFGDEEQIRDFSEYLLEKYDPVRIVQAADEWYTQFDQGIAYSVDENAYHGLSQKLYKETGKSLYVLWNEFQGILEDETVANAHHIYFKEAEEPEIQISFAGDICLTEDGFVIDHYDEVNGDLSQCISDDIENVTRNADIFMLNHEYPASERGTALAGKYYTFRAEPKREEILNELGTDIVSLANNHIYDYGADALMDTFQCLRDENIPYVGAGADMEEAKKPVYFIINGMKIGFVAANRSEKIIYTPEAGENTPGVVRMYDTAMMDEIISEASKECDYLIAYLHWGTEDSPYYEEYQRNIAKEFIDQGADAIIGGHPHVLQGVEYIEGKPVVYSLGDFWFNSETKYTTVLNLKVDMEGLKEMSLLPCRQENDTTHMLYRDEAAQFYDYMRGLSPNAGIDSAGVVSPAE